MSELVGQLCESRGAATHALQTRERQREVLDPLNAAEYLLIASSIDSVEVDTTRYDQSVMYCDLAADHETKWSNLLSDFTAQLTIFGFVWGAFETVTKVIKPPRVPKSVKPGSSWVDEAIFYLKNRYEPMPPPIPYDIVVTDLRQALERIRCYGNLTDEFRVQPGMGTTGVGLHVVRRIRNRFAHGTMEIPVPEAESYVAGLHMAVIGLSTAVVLLTLQTLLSAFFKDVSLAIEDLSDEWDGLLPESLADVLQTLQLRLPDIDESQPPLF